MSENCGRWVSESERCKEKISTSPKEEVDTTTQTATTDAEISRDSTVMAQQPRPIALREVNDHDEKMKRSDGLVSSVRRASKNINNGPSSIRTTRAGLLKWHGNLEKRGG